MNLEELKELVDYHYWARDRMLDAVEKLPQEDYTREVLSSFRSVRDTLVHVFSAESVWLSRWQGESPAAMLQAESFADVRTLRDAWASNEVRMRLFVDSLGEEGIRRVIEYRTFNGQEWKQVLWQMLQHVVNHSSYHRGQVTTLIRQLQGTPPASMDLITYYRER